MSVLPFALPAAAAGVAYLNGRHGFTYDWPMISALFGSQINGALLERRDQLNLFYELESHAQSSRANQPWIIFQGKRWTYAQAYDTVLRYGVWLKSKGIEKDDIVAMDFVNSDVFVWVWFGLWSIGARPAFINYNLTGKPLVHTVKTSTAKLVLVDQESKANFNDDAMREQGFIRTDCADKVEFSFQLEESDIPRSLKKQTQSSDAAVESSAERKVEVIFFDDALTSHILTQPATRFPDSVRSGQTRTSMAMLIYTSGTTGLPKPAYMAWGRFAIGSKFTAIWLGLNNNDVLYASMPLYHSSASILGLCSVLRAGSTICISRKFSHKTFWPEIRESNATILQYVGETCRYLLSAPPSPLDKQHKLRAAFGNGLRPDVWEAFKERFGIETIFEFYAATESPGALFNRSSNSFSTGAIARNGTIGTMLMAQRNCLVRMDPESDPPEPIRDPKTGLCQICDWNEPGEMLSKLDAANIKQSFQGYFGNSKATNSKIIRDVKTKGDAYFRTGDLMRWDDQGRFWFVDRLGDTFRWKAENVSTAEVSEALGKHPAVAEANVYGVQIPRHDGRAGCAAVVFKDQAAGAPSDAVLSSLAQHVKKELPAFAAPIWIRVTKEMQLTGTNKQQKHLLQKDGIDPAVVEKDGDLLYWLKNGTYVRFTKADLETIEGGGVKL
ncbi:acetyl-CoA synthetase-like protein [Curvularia clavata]|uniref:Acetyl-CoA synthetase-like protein n=1 Tax=Curvularia clavata TaxID=95742 RepID=A0A9Q8ZII5_CURCL|nr:acetyl-CoA synthetase-like protein [Curvularia clavata]